MSAIQQGRSSSIPPGARPVPGTAPTTGARQGHYAMVARMVRDVELGLERVTDLEEIPMDLLARFARALNRAERSTLARVQTMEESES